MKKSKESKEAKKMIDSSSKMMIAKKDWVIIMGKWLKEENRNEIEYRIKKGDDLSDLPPNILDILKIEKVL